MAAVGPSADISQTVYNVTCKSKYERMFIQVDSNNDGSIDCQELGVGLAKLGLNGSAERCQQLMRMYAKGATSICQSDFVEMAKHLEYELLFDGDGSGDLSRIEKTIMKYDLDKSGNFSIAEVKAICEDLEDVKETNKKMGKLVVALILAFLFAFGAILCVVLMGNEMSKENHTDEASAELVTKNGDAVATAAVESFTGLRDLLRADIPNPLSYLKALEFETNWIADGSVSVDMWKVMSYSKYGANRLVVRFDYPMEVVITDTAIEVRKDGVVVGTVDEPVAEGRSLSDASEDVKLCRTRALLHEHKQSQHSVAGRRRRLGRRGGNLQTKSAAGFTAQEGNHGGN